MIERKKILFVYDYFTPAFKAGGPIRSLHNLVALLGSVHDCYVYTGDCDLDGADLGVEINTWLKFNEKSHVFYSSKSYRKDKGFEKVVKRLNPDTVYLNGLFSIDFVVNPLKVLQKTDFSGKLVLAPRGMLQEGAFRLKRYKKLPYLWFLKGMGLLDGVTWHATDLQEQKDIRSRVEGGAEAILPNVPYFQSKRRLLIGDSLTEIRFVSVSLLGRMKNHLKFLRALMKVPEDGKPIIYDIYGPIKDMEYWRECKALIVKLPRRVKCSYKGAIVPHEVSDVLSSYHFFVLPTLGENFGHAIFEAFNVGVPVLISNKTPWRNLEGKGAGWDLPLDGDYFEKQLLSVLDLEVEGYVALRHGARKLALDFMASNDFVAGYTRLFST